MNIAMKQTIYVYMEKGYHNNYIIHWLYIHQTGLEGSLDFHLSFCVVQVKP